MVDVSFTPSERKVYLLSLEYSPLEFKQISHGDISKCTQVPVKNIPKVLKSIDKKISVSARYDELRFLVSKYFRILQLTQSHYKEENRKNTHVFNIDFSELYAYLNPREALDEQKNIIFDNIGSIYYMFNSKQKKHTYCMLPPAIWELINKLYVRRMTVDQINYDDFNNNNEKMKDFYELINDWKGKYPATFSSELMSRYNAMGKGRSVVNTLNTLVLTKQGELEKRLKYNRSTLKEMFDKDTIQSMNDEIVGNVNEVKINKTIYRKAISNLNFCRPDGDINNQVDAANLAITYDLTKKRANGSVYRLISHSKQPTEAFKNIECNKTRISCCPQFLSTLILFENNSVKGVDNDDFNQKMKYLDDNTRRLERIRNECYDVQYRSVNVKYLENQINYMEESISPIFRHLSDLTEYAKQAYTSNVVPLMNINAGKIKREGYYKGDDTILQNIFSDQEEYKELVRDASNIIYDDLKETYVFLCNHVNGDLLTPQMRAVWAEISKTVDEPTKIF